MSYNPKQLFPKLQATERANAESNTTGGSYGNPLLFKPKVGTTYAVRLLWLMPAAGCDREYPMINSYIHRVWDETGEISGNKDNKIVCPTSQYMMGETSMAFKKCPICTAASEFYKKGQEGSESGKELYSKFRRTCCGYVPVLIVNGPAEEIGQVKILQYGKQFKDFFDSKIFGIKKQNRNAEEAENSMLDDEAIGLEAFMYYDETNDSIITKGYNVLITTTSKKMVLNGKQVDMPQYTLDFTRKLSNIVEIDGVDLTDNTGIKFFNSLNEKVLKFDETFYLKSTEEELNQFKLNFISKTNIDDTAETIRPRPSVVLPKKTEVSTIIDDDEEEDAIPMSKPAVKKPVEDDPEELDIDDLVNNLVN